MVCHARLRRRHLFHWHAFNSPGLFAVFGVPSCGGHFCLRGKRHYSHGVGDQGITEGERERESERARERKKERKIEREWVGGRREDGERERERERAHERGREGGTETGGWRDREQCECVRILKYFRRIKAPAEEQALAISLVSFFTIFYMLALPYLALALGIDLAVAAAWIGGSVNNTGNVVASVAILDASAKRSDGGACPGPGCPSEMGPVIKMAQNAILGVVTVGISVYWMTYEEEEDGEERDRAADIEMAVSDSVLKARGLAHSDTVAAVVAAQDALEQAPEPAAVAAAAAAHAPAPDDSHAEATQQQTQSSAQAAADEGGAPGPVTRIPDASSCDAAADGAGGGKLSGSCAQGDGAGRGASRRRAGKKERPWPGASWCGGGGSSE